MHWYNFINNSIRKLRKPTKPVPFQLNSLRVFAMWCGVFALASMLIARLVYIMILTSPELISKGNDRVLRTVYDSIERGIIMDRNGDQLAISVPVKAISIYCKDFHDKDGGFVHKEEMREIAKLLEIDYDTMMKRVNKPTNRYVYIARQVEEPVANYIKSLKIKGIIVSDELRRFYPTGEINAHLIGRTNIDGNGTEGIEKQYNDLLLSTPGKRRQIKDIKGNVIANLGVLSDRKKANDLVLSIDQRLQQRAYMALKYATEVNQATSASLVLLDAKTGEMLAMVNSPSYNPNNRENFASYKARNRAVTDVYEPGSTTKPLIALGALANNNVNWKEIFDTRSFPVNGKLITDSHKMNTGNLFDIIKYSSNTGMAHIALRMDPHIIMSTLESFGYGHKTNLNLIGENTGRLPLKRNRWSNIEQATVGFGYGIMVTPLQIAQAYGVLANYGIKYPLSIFKIDEVPKGKRVANEADVRRMLEALESVVEEGGTGMQAMVPGYRVGGKTGTAKVAIAGGYGKDYVGAFVGIAPMGNPRFVMVVIINEPHSGKFYGGVVAGPVFSEVMQRTLQLYNIPPDDLNPDGTVRTIEQKKKELYRKTSH